MSGSSSNTKRGAVDVFRDEALRESQDFIQHLLNLDFEWCRLHVSSDFMYVGPRLIQYTTTFEEFYRTLSPSRRENPTSATEEEYSVVACSGPLCAVVGRFLTFTPSEAQDIFAQWYRTTLVWRRTSEGLRLQHLHMSTPEPGDGDSADLPVRTGTETYRYIKSLMKIGSTRKNISLYDVDGTVHWMHPSQVIYLEANRKRTIVHCMTKDVVVPAVIKDVVDMVGDKVVRVHRSYAVNRDHVVELKLGRLLLDDGTTIAIPAKRIADVRAELSMN